MSLFDLVPSGLEAIPGAVAAGMVVAVALVFVDRAVWGFRRMVGVAIADAKGKLKNWGDDHEEEKHDWTPDSDDWDEMREEIYRENPNTKFARRQWEEMNGPREEMENNAWYEQGPNDLQQFLRDVKEHVLAEIIMDEQMREITEQAQTLIWRETEMARVNADSFRGAEDEDEINQDEDEDENEEQPQLENESGNDWWERVSKSIGLDRPTTPEEQELQQKIDEEFELQDDTTGRQAYDSRNDPQDIEKLKAAYWAKVDAFYANLPDEDEEDDDDTEAKMEDEANGNVDEQLDDEALMEHEEQGFSPMEDTGEDNTSGEHEDFVTDDPDQEAKD